MYFLPLFFSSDFLIPVCLLHDHPLSNKQSSWRIPGFQRATQLEGVFLVFDLLLNSCVCFFSLLLFCASVSVGTHFGAHRLELEKENTEKKKGEKKGGKRKKVRKRKKTKRFNTHVPAFELCVDFSPTIFRLALRIPCWAVYRSTPAAASAVFSSLFNQLLLPFASALLRIPPPLCLPSPVGGSCIDWIVFPPPFRLLPLPYI